jgi:hypothetical protein
MRIARFLLVLGSIFAVLAPAPALAQMIPPHVISSIDSMVLNEDFVAVGRILQAGPGNRDSTEVTIAIDSVLKGWPQTTAERRQARGSGNRLSTDELSSMAALKARVLIVGNGFTPLNDSGLVIPAANGTLLGGATEVVTYIQQLLRAHPPGQVLTIDIPLPKQLANVTVARFFDSAAYPGQVATEFRMPVDDPHVEAWALEAIRSNSELSRAFRAIRFFKSASNIEFVRPFLADPAFDAYNINGVEGRTYRTRQQAYDLLQFWNVPVDPPVLREEIPRFETLESFTWGLGPEDRFDQVAALSKNLRDLNIASSFHPSRERLEKIADMRSLTRLRLNGSDKKEALKFIPNLVNIEELILQAVGITDNDLASFLSLPRLKTLDLQNNRISDAGLKTLAGIPTLKTLNVSRTLVSLRGIAEVRTLRPDLEIKQ